jgi:hypothetical protein
MFTLIYRAGESTLQACNPRQEVEISKIKSQGQPQASDKKLLREHRLGVEVHDCNPSHTGSVNRRIALQASPA